MFAFLPTALAAIALGWPCQRLNWAWRNVWVTCSITAYVPAATPYASAGYNQLSSLPYAPFFSSINNPLTQLDATGVFTPSNAAGVGSGPTLCQNSPNSGGGFMRNRCRRMLDTYGNLVQLCKTPAKSGASPNALTPDYAPNPGHNPHALNVAQLGFLAQACITPGAAFPTPANTCPGLQGWFTVVWNACGFTNAPGVGSPGVVGTTVPGATYVPNYLTAATTTTAFTLNTPSNLCGTSPTGPSTSFTTTSATVFNGKGPFFRTSRCRKALDQFGRTASRCGAPTMGVNDPLRFLAQSLGSVSPNCN